ncbi:hypothetical protein IMZ31_19930 (plasmid) [Pontibacillus sp. ALD_SL1]|uniref:hypothetical protein n=1 Tax=Pontibacillus sp. ALD_SL1 TaxID=2777185 RepID=UPI001A95DE2B|nr:hypothetical protein [Pontibacillus sp. ALD_SL1]QST02822.1 hypothetical protein IMZ31_19930 [Pontibacillus sp. ALD_SL1]
MKYTNLFFCESGSCSWKQTAVEGDGWVACQCSSCHDISSYKMSTAYALQCKGCGGRVPIQADEPLHEKASCESCGLDGDVAYTDGMDGLFSLEKMEGYVCYSCHEPNHSDDDHLHCPRCRSKVKRKMSTFWEGEME